jgi:hypothetical protein
MYLVLVEAVVAAAPLLLADIVVVHELQGTEAGREVRGGRTQDQQGQTGGAASLDAAGLARMSPAAATGAQDITKKLPSSSPPTAVHDPRHPLRRRTCLN